MPTPFLLPSRKNRVTFIVLRLLTSFFFCIFMLLFNPKVCKTTVLSKHGCGLGVNACTSVCFANICTVCVCRFSHYNHFSVLNVWNALFHTDDDRRDVLISSPLLMSFLLGGNFKCTQPFYMFAELLWRSRANAGGWSQSHILRRPRAKVTDICFDLMAGVSWSSFDCVFISEYEQSCLKIDVM